MESNCEVCLKKECVCLSCKFCQEKCDDNICDTCKYNLCETCNKNVCDEDLCRWCWECRDKDEVRCDFCYEVKKFEGMDKNSYTYCIDCKEKI